jgi:hypothetical protein
MEPIVGDEVLSHRHILSSKSLQPLLANDSFVTDEEPLGDFKIKNHIKSRHNHPTKAQEVNDSLEACTLSP